MFFREEMLALRRTVCFWFRRQTTAKTYCHQSPPLNSRWESILRVARRVCRSMSSRTRRTWLVCSREQSDAVAGCTRTLSRCSSRHVRSEPSEPRSRSWRASPGGRRGRTSGWSGWTESQSNIRHSSWIAEGCIGMRAEYVWWLLLGSPLIIMLFLLVRCDISSRCHQVSSSEKWQHLHVSMTRVTLTDRQQCLLDVGVNFRFTCW